MTQEPNSEKVVFDKPSLPSINIQNLNETEETYYGRFRSIVKQRFFGLKLEEDPFMEYVDSNPVRKVLIFWVIFLLGSQGETWRLYRLYG